MLWWCERIEGSRGADGDAHDFCSTREWRILELQCKRLNSWQCAISETGRELYFARRLEQHSHLRVVIALLERQALDDILRGQVALRQCAATDEQHERRQPQEPSGV